MILMLFFMKSKKIGGNFATDEELPTVKAKKLEEILQQMKNYPLSFVI